MKRFLRCSATCGLVAVAIWLVANADAGRFGGGGMRAGGGAVRTGGGGFAAGGYSASARVNTPMARPASVQRSTNFSSFAHGPMGGSVVAGGGQRSFTGAGGTTINRGGAGYAYTGPRGGVAIGGGRAGSVTGPGGRTIGGGEAGHVVIGPNGNVHAGGTRAGGVVGPNGAAIAGSHGAVNVGPGGVAARGTRVGAAVGPGGVVAGGTRVGGAVGPYGGVAAGGRSAVAVGPYGAVARGGSVVAAGGYRGSAVVGTRYVGATTLAGRGTYVRTGFAHYDAFTPRWNARYPGAWVAAGWTAASAWRYAPWGICSTYVGYPATVTPIYFNYGDNVTYQEGNVYYGDQIAATEAGYAQQATQIADAGKQVQPPPDETWQPLGVFAMTKGDETTSNDIFQLALGKDGVIRGNYYNAVADTTTPVYGSLDKKSQRLAWTIGDKKTPVYETGLYNLTQEQTTILVHLAPDRTEQWNLFRIEQPKEGQAPAAPAVP